MTKTISAWLAPLGPGEATVHPYRWRIDMARPPKWDHVLPVAERLPADAWEAVPDDDWTLDVPPTHTRCRNGSPWAGFCGRPPVATLRRGSHRRLWSYCERHLYGRWIEGGQVLSWRVRQ